MFLALFVLILLVVLLAYLALNGLLLWLGCKISVVSGATYWQAVRAAFTNYLLTMALAVFAVLAIPFQKMPFVEALALQLVLLFMIVVVVPIACIRVQWRVSFGKSFLVCVLWNVFAGISGVVLGIPLFFLVKQTVAEAFVIPTGAMAETLRGYHKQVVCPECGFEFPVNCSLEVDTVPHLGQMKVSGCTCPNCRLNIGLGRGDGQSSRIEDPGPSDGDRILVSKMNWGPLGGKPERFDIIVFRYPGPPPFGGVAPAGPVNYVKRVVGIGPETIGIHYGDLYVASGELPPAKPTKTLRIRNGDVIGELEFIPPMNPDAHCTLLEEGDPCFQILRKPPDLIQTMKRIVYDNDHPARDLEGKLPPRWAGVEDDGAWASAEPHGFRHTPPDTDRFRWLRYRHVLRGGEGKPELITDFLGYNTYETIWRQGAAPDINWVGDLILGCEVTVEDARGELVLELSKGVDRFRARWDLATGVCTLLRLQHAHTGDKPPAESDFRQIGEANTALRSRGKYLVRLANVDRRLTVWVDGTLPFGDGVDYEAPAKRGPYPNDLQPASIGVKAGTVSVHHIKLWRDTYYTRAPGSADVIGWDRWNWGDPEWEPLRRLPSRTFEVPAGHYFCLGDNSSESSDSRVWGLVPEANLIGKAMMIYYPLSRAGRVR